MVFLTVGVLGFGQPFQHCTRKNCRHMIGWTLFSMHQLHIAGSILATINPNKLIFITIRLWLQLHSSVSVLLPFFTPFQGWLQCSVFAFTYVLKSTKGKTDSDGGNGYKLQTCVKISTLQYIIAMHLYFIDNGIGLRMHCSRS